MNARTRVVEEARLGLPGLAAVALLGVLACSGCSSDDDDSSSPPVAGASGFAGSISNPIMGAAGVPSGGIGGSIAAGAGAAGSAGSAASTGSAGSAGSNAAPAGSGGSGMSGQGGSGGMGAAGMMSDSGSGGSAGAAGSAGASGSGGMGGSAGSAGSSGSGGMGGSAGASAQPPKKFCGNITTGGRVRSDFINFWNQITPENEGKWGSVEGTRDQMNWAGLDAVHTYAKDHNIPFKQHTLVWGSQQPGWISGLSQADQRAEVEEWIRLFCERYPDTQLIDVVNEPPPHTNPPYAAALGGAGASGYDWIVQSFKWARQYCPNAILILNDYNTIEYANDNSHFIDIVKRIKAAGAPIDAVGAQAHAAYNIPTNTVKMYLDKLASETGLPVYISEYDINLADDARQKQVMEAEFTMFWNHDKVAGITLWGYIEGQTWLDNSGLMSSGGQQRPAMSWLMDFLGR